MSGRYIDAELFLQKNAELANCEILHPKCFNTLKELIDEAPTADVVEVVRCKDCKWFRPSGKWGIDWCTHTDGLVIKEDGYCSDGTRRE